MPAANATKKISNIRREAVQSRWEAVREQEESFIEPFKTLPINKAMVYLDDLRHITEIGGHILNDRIGKDKNKMACSGPRCGKDLSGTRPNGMPLWIAKKDIRDKDIPNLIYSLYFCSELCHNQYVRAHNGAMGGTQ